MELLECLDFVEVPSLGWPPVSAADRALDSGDLHIWQALHWHRVQCVASLHQPPHCSTLESPVRLEAHDFGGDGAGCGGGGGGDAAGLHMSHALHWQRLQCAAFEATLQKAAQLATLVSPERPELHEAAELWAAMNGARSASASQRRAIII